MPEHRGVLKKKVNKISCCAQRTGRLGRYLNNILGEKWFYRRIREVIPVERTLRHAKYQTELNRVLQSTQVKRTPARFY